jgi:hypothetical protein
LSGHQNHGSFQPGAFPLMEKKGFERHLVQAGKKRDARLADVPPDI